MHIKACNQGADASQTRRRSMMFVINDLCRLKALRNCEQFAFRKILHG
jgi:hypothetical protein